MIAAYIFSEGCGKHFFYFFPSPTLFWSKSTVTTPPRTSSLSSNACELGLVLSSGRLPPCLVREQGGTSNRRFIPSASGALPRRQVQAALNSLGRLFHSIGNPHLPLFATWHRTLDIPDALRPRVNGNSRRYWQ